MFPQFCGYGIKPAGAGYRPLRGGKKKKTTKKRTTKKKGGAIPIAGILTPLVIEILKPSASAIGKVIPKVVGKIGKFFRKLFGFGNDEVLIQTLQAIPKAKLKELIIETLPKLK